MPVTDIFWDTDVGYDLHVIRGATSPRLDKRLWIDQDPGRLVKGDAPPAGVVVRFNPQFAGAPSNHGVTVDTSTGAVTAAAAAPVPLLRNFLIKANVNDTVAGNTFEVSIRIHIHQSISKIWLTPDPLTIHHLADGLRFSVLAQFDDGTIGDVSNWPNLRWSTSDAAKVEVDASTGVLVAKQSNVQAVITVREERLPPAQQPTATATVKTESPWFLPKAPDFIAGKGAAHWNDVPNILFLPDGFKASEKGDYERLVRAIVRQLNQRKTLTPFQLIKDDVNYWSYFVPSPEDGISLLPECTAEVRQGGKIWGAVVPQPEKPRPGSWTLEEMVHEVGLPVAIDDPPGRPLVGPGGKLTDWQTLYGPHVTQALVRASYPDWLKLATRRVLNERNSAFGIALGERPQVEQKRVSRHISFHPRRTTSFHLDDFLESFEVGGVPMGRIWTTGKDYGLVGFVCKSLFIGGVNVTDYFACSLGGSIEHQLQISPSGNGLDIVPSPVPKRPTSELVAVVAHEAAHSLEIGDEYGGNGPLPDSVSDGNLQLRSTLINAATPPQLVGNKVKWDAWPRIEKAGVLTQVLQAAGANDFKIFIQKKRSIRKKNPQQPGETFDFAVGDIVRLRKPFLLLDPPVSPSDRLRVLNVDPNTHPNEVEILVSVLGNAPTPADYPIDSLLIAPVRAPDGPGGTLGDDLSLMSRVIRDHITASGGPLNAPLGSPLQACVDDNSDIQPARNLPAAVIAARTGTPQQQRRPRYNSWIIGLYDGGDGTYCGIYHPTGACQMRSHTVYGNTKVYGFCPVCRYIIVDRLAPHMHGPNDEYFQERDPQP